jgi:hypothetical protein
VPFVLCTLGFVVSAEASTVSVQSGASGLAVAVVECRNLASGTRVRFSTGADEWNCADSGFLADPGDSVSVTVRGRSDGRVPLFIAHPFGGGANGPLASADFEPDGDVDLVQANAFGWWEHDGNDPAALTFHALDGLEPVPSALTIGDIDGNGRPDVVASFGGNTQKLVWYKNTGGSPVDFVVKPIESQSGWVHHGVATGDLDGDGDEDVAAVLTETGGPSAQEELVWLENTGGGASFVRSVLDSGPAPGGFSDAVAVADLDGDGDRDIAFGDTREQILRWFENDGSDQPGFTARFVDPAFYVSSFDVTDADADGDLDIIPSVSSVSDDELRLYENDGGAPASFAIHGLGSFPDRASGRSIASDLTGNGVPDILMPAGSFLFSEFPVVWLEKSSDSPTAYTEHRLPHLDNYVTDLLAVDMDGRDRTDIVGAADLNPDGDLLWYEIRAAVGGWIHSVTPSKVRCRNLTSGQTVQSSLGEDSWDCQELGLSVVEGDRVEMTVLGTVE